jgi:hypothetical protein
MNKGSKKHKRKTYTMGTVVTPDSNKLHLASPRHFIVQTFSYNKQANRLNVTMDTTPARRKATRSMEPSVSPRKRM